MVQLNDILHSYEIAPGIEALTNSQGKYILGYSSADALRNRLVAEGFARWDEEDARNGKTRPINQAVFSFLKSSDTPADVIDEQSSTIERHLGERLLDGGRVSRRGGDGEDRGGGIDENVSCQSRHSDPT